MLYSFKVKLKENKYEKENNYYHNTFLKNQEMKAAHNVLPFFIRSLTVCKINVTDKPNK